MEIIIEDRAKEYIREKSKDKTIRINVIEAENC